jgi:hypothetical protein
MRAHGPRVVVQRRCSTSESLACSWIQDADHLPTRESSARFGHEVKARLFGLTNREGQPRRRRRARSGTPVRVRRSRPIASTSAWRSGRHLVGGAFTIVTQPGQGTTIQVRVGDCAGESHVPVCRSVTYRFCMATGRRATYSTERCAVRPRAVRSAKSGLLLRNARAVWERATKKLEEGGT